MPVDKLCSFYTHFNASKIPDLGEIYDAKVAFVDPLHKVDGLPALKAYFSHLCDGQGQYRFAITHKLINQNQGFITCPCFVTSIIGLQSMVPQV